MAVLDRFYCNHLLSTHFRQVLLSSLAFYAFAIADTFYSCKSIEFFFLQKAEATGTHGLYAGRMYTVHIITSCELSLESSQLKSVSRACR